MVFQTLYGLVFKVIESNTVKIHFWIFLYFVKTIQIIILIIIYIWTCNVYDDNNVYIVLPK